MSCEFCKDRVYRDVLGTPCKYNFCPMCGDALTEQKPLTLGELREMDGGPVWIETGETLNRERITGRWDILERRTTEFGDVFWFENRVKGLPAYNYGKTWLAYRRPPKEAPQ